MTMKSDKTERPEDKAELRKLRRKIAEGLEQADRGELLDGDDVFRDVKSRIEALQRALIDGEASGDAGELDFNEIRRLGRKRAEQERKPR